MKKIFNYTVLLLSAFMLCLTGCKQEELVFDHERQQFETKADAILLEFIAPAGSALDEVIYITGAFSDGKKFQLEKTKNDKKWGIYLYAEDFQNGKTLKDGFTFVSEKNGLLYTIKGEPDTCYTDITYGQWTNIWGMRWESQFKTGDEPEEIVPGKYEHLYIIGNVENIGWTPADVLEFEMVGTDIFRGEFTFPNATSYFAILTAKGETNDDWATVNAARWGANDALLTEGAVLDLQLQDGSDQCVTIAQGTYTITVNMVTNQIVIGNGDWGTGSGNTGDKWPTVKHDGDAVYVMDAAGWGAMRLYMYGTTNNLNGDWPGMVPTDSVVFKGNKWYYFDLGAANAGQEEHLIFNNGNGVQIAGTIEPFLTLTGGDSIYYYVLTSKDELTRVEDPASVAAAEPEPTPDPEPGRIDTVIVTLHDSVTTHLYFVDHSTNMHYVYAWGSYELFGGWMAGDNAKWADWESVTFLGQTFHHYAFKAEAGNEFNLIIANKGYADLAEADQKQYDAFTVKVGESTDLFYEIYDDHATKLVPTAAEISKIRLLLHK